MATQWPVTLGEPREKKRGPSADVPPQPGQQSRAEYDAGRKNKVLDRLLQEDLQDMGRNQKFSLLGLRVEAIRYKRRASRLNDRIKVCKTQDDHHHHHSQEKDTQGQDQTHNKMTSKEGRGQGQRRPKTSQGRSGRREVQGRPPRAKTCNVFGRSQGHRHGFGGQGRPKSWNVLERANVRGVEPLFKVRRNKVRNVWSSSDNDDDDDDEVDDDFLYSSINSEFDTKPRGIQSGQIRRKNTLAPSNKRGLTKHNSLTFSDDISTFAIERVQRAQTAFPGIKTNTKHSSSSPRVTNTNTATKNSKTTNTNRPTQNKPTSSANDHRQFGGASSLPKLNPQNSFNAGSNSRRPGLSDSQTSNHLSKSLSDKSSSGASKHAASQSHQSRSKQEEDRGRRGNVPKATTGSKDGAPGNSEGLSESISSAEAFRRAVLDLEWDRYEINQRKVAEYLMSLKVQ